MTSRSTRLLAAALTLALLAACRGKDLADDYALQGVVELDERRLAFETAGKVATVTVHRGDTLAADAEMAHLDDTLAKRTRDARTAEVRAAEAQLSLLAAGPRADEVRAAEADLGGLRTRVSQLERNLARQRNLAGQGAVVLTVVDDLADELTRARQTLAAAGDRLRGLRSGARSQEIDAASARVDAARAALAVQDEQLARLGLKTTVPGTVLDVFVEVGEVVGPGTPVVTVADTGHPYVDVFVPAASVVKVALGQAASVHMDGLTATLPGQVEDIARTTEFTPRYMYSPRERPHLVVRVRVRIDDPKRLLRAGMPAFVDLPGVP